MKIDDTDVLIEKIAEAVVRKIDERDKINLLAEAVLERLQESSLPELRLPEEAANTPAENRPDREMVAAASLNTINVPMNKS